MRAEGRMVPQHMTARRMARLPQRWIAAALLAMAILPASIGLSTLASADSEDTARAAVNSLRSASCSPLQSNPAVEETARVLNQSTDAWLNQTGRAAPVDDPMATLKDRGYSGERAKLLQGSARTDAGAIKGILLQGYLDIPDCSFKTYGLSVLQNRTTNYFLAALVVAA